MATDWDELWDAETVPGEAPQAAALADRMPARHNQQSELKVDVSPGRTEYNFDPTSK